MEEMYEMMKQQEETTKELEIDRNERECMQNENEITIRMDNKEMELEQHSNARRLEEAEREAAYQMETTGHFFFIQETEEGYDYTFYDQEFHELDGGIYDNFDVTLQEAAKELLLEEGEDLTVCRKIDSEMLQEQVEKADYFPQKSYEELKSLVESEEQYEGKLTPTSQIDIREEKLLHGESRQNIEETILCYAQAKLEEAGYENVTLLAARVYGSRTRETLYREDSDLDVVLSYTGDIREDTFFNLLQENGMKIAGLKVDINPISLEKTGTLQEYMKRAEQYLDERESEKNTIENDERHYRK